MKKRAKKSRTKAAKKAVKRPRKKATRKPAKRAALRDLTAKRTAGTVAGGGSTVAPSGSSPFAFTVKDVQVDKEEGEPTMKKVKSSGATEAAAM